ncbi:DoxX family protein [Haloferula chungangensis]|uniref:DoxX family protein n=1 Tax=Haloferula chungangensis TaxID=1048331 RepID=A0ABW2LE65_9BACT
MPTTDHEAPRQSAPTPAAKASPFRNALRSNAPAATLLIRVMVGGVFLSEGIQKFLYADDRGAGRFEKIGIPSPEILGPFVGSMEIVCGALLLLGLATRFAAIPLIAIMLTALYTTKLPILIGEEFGGFSLRPLSRYGLLSMLHEARTDLSMLLGSLFLLITGSGPFSLDAKLTRS